LSKFGAFPPRGARGREARTALERAHGRLAGAGSAGPDWEGLFCLGPGAARSPELRLHYGGLHAKAHPLNGVF